MKIVLFLTLLFRSSVFGYSSTDLERLKKQLFASYDSSIRPIYNQTNQIKVTIKFAVRSLIYFDMTNGQLDTMGILVANWKDEKLSWDDTEFSDIPKIALYGHELWHPEIVQLNAMTDEVFHESFILFRDGTVIKATSRKFYTFCELNMRFYPNDKHECSYEFLSLRYPAEHLMLVPEGAGVDISLATPHGEWTFTDTHVEQLDIEIKHSDIQVNGGSIIFSIFVKRQSVFYVIHRSIPLAVLAFCTLFIHAIPLDSGERISYAVTILLAFVFWQALVADELPKNSSKISIFSMIVTLFLVILGVSTGTSVVLCRIIDFKSDKKIPKILLKLVIRHRAHNTPDETVNRHTPTSNNPAKRLEQILVNGHSNGQMTINTNQRVAPRNIIPSTASRQNLNWNHVRTINCNTIPSQYVIQTAKAVDTNDRSTKGDFQKSAITMNKNISNNMDISDEGLLPVTWGDVANRINMYLFIVHIIVAIASGIAHLLIFVL